MTRQAADGLWLLGLSAGVLVVAAAWLAVAWEAEMSIREWINGRREREMANDDEERARDVIAGARAANPDDEAWEPHTDPRGNGTAQTARPNDAAGYEVPDDLAVPAGYISQAEVNQRDADDFQPLREPQPGEHTRDAIESARRAALEDSGVHHMPAIREDGIPAACEPCNGTGVVVRSVSELLAESRDMIPDPKALVLQFYRNLLAMAPHLAEIFPPDILTDAMDNKNSRGVTQREKLLEALLALADLYHPDDPDRMERLDNALVSMGNRHPAFFRPSLGRARPATVREFGAVIEIFLQTVHDMVPNWRAEHDQAWDEALDHAAREMIAAIRQWLKEHPNAMPRMPRESR